MANSDLTVFQTRLTKSNLRNLKLMSAMKGVPIFELVNEMIEFYASRHPGLLLGIGVSEKEV